MVPGAAVVLRLIYGRGLEGSRLRDFLRVRGRSEDSALRVPRVLLQLSNDLGRLFYARDDL